MLISTGLFADRIVIGFPFAITYTVQYSGADFSMRSEISGFLNFLHTKEVWLRWS